MDAFAVFLMAIAVAGTVTSTVFLILTILASQRFRRDQRIKAEQVSTKAAGWPPVCVMKPLHGAEPRLRETLESFFRQDYPTYEIIFGARSEADPALAIVASLCRQYPALNVKVVTSGEPQWPNAKVWSLGKMVPFAESEYLIISDSDAQVAPDYLRHVTFPLLEKKTGLVTCLYRGFPMHGLWATIEGIGMSVDMASGVMLANMLEGMRFALGPTMAIRCDSLLKAGGLRAIADYYSDDFELGRLIAEAGYHVELSHHVIDHMVTDTSFVRSLDHQLRWMKSTRYSRPWGHVGSGLTFAVPFGLLGIAAAAIARAYGFTDLQVGSLKVYLPGVAVGLFTWSIANRVIQALVVGWGVVRDRRALMNCWLYPLRDVIGFVLWLLSFTGGSFVWRGEKYCFHTGGRISAYRSGLPPQTHP